MNGGRFLSLLVAFRNTATHMHSEIKQNRSRTRQEFSGEAFSKQIIEASLTSLSCSSSRATTKWSAIFAFSVYSNFYSCRPPGVMKGFIKGQALRLLRTNSSQTTFEENIRNFAAHLKNRGYPAVTLVVKHLSEVKFSEREMLLTNKDRTHKRKFYPLSHKLPSGFA